MLSLRSATAAKYAAKRAIKLAIKEALLEFNQKTGLDVKAVIVNNTDQPWRVDHLDVELIINL